MSRRILFGHDVHEAQRARKVTMLGNRELYPSEELSRWQQQEARLGILEAEIVESIGGYSVRYASGLQDFGLLASSRRGDVDGSWESALAFAREWQAKAPDRRFVTTRIAADPAPARNEARAP